jgi:threonylcarbamoyladenosine tRNA methylthiotransferase MtaB
MPKRNSPQVETFGCRLNIWESEVIRDKAASAGLQDAIIFNTCAVTSEAEKQARQAIRKARRENPDSQIIVTGCAAQIAAENWTKMDEVDVVLGNHDKLQTQSWHDLASINVPAPNRDEAGQGTGRRSGQRYHAGARNGIAYAGWLSGTYPRLSANPARL